MDQCSPSADNGFLFLVHYWLFSCIWGTFQTAACIQCSVGLDSRGLWVGLSSVLVFWVMYSKKKKKTGSTVSVLFLGQAELALLKTRQAELEQGRFVKRGVE